MAEYIDRDKVLEAILALPPKMDEQGYGWLGRMGVWQMIRDFQSADVAPMEWIPVSERLPDFEGMCLCMRKSYSKANFRHQEIMYFDYDEQAFCSNVDGIFVADGNVTHWMPLPKPPKDGET